MTLNHLTAFIEMIGGICACLGATYWFVYRSVDHLTANPVIAFYFAAAALGLTFLLGCAYAIAFFYCLMVAAMFAFLTIFVIKR